MPEPLLLNGPGFWDGIISIGPSFFTTPIFAVGAASHGDLTRLKSRRECPSVGFPWFFAHAAGNRRTHS